MRGGNGGVSAEPSIKVVDDPASVAAERLATAAEAGAHIALSGGSTPRAAYERAASMAGNWSRATLWFGDDRCVPPEHEHSNFRMVKEALLDRLTGPVPDVRRIEGERQPADAADHYDRALREVFDGRPEIDLCLMGLGPDAHTASLFPRDAALGERDRLATAVETPGMAPFVARVTMTIPVFEAVREMLFLVAGEDKGEAVRRAFAGPSDPDAPASMVRPRGGTLTVLADPAAAAELSEEARGE